MKKDMVIMLILCILLGAGIAFMWREQDQVAPTIIIPDEQVNYIEGKTDNLLEDVKAHDDIDGDVSSSLYVKVSIDEKNSKAYVTYYAKDKSNNVSKATREAGIAKEIGGEATSEMLPAEQAEEQEPTSTPEVTSQPEETPVSTEAESESPRITLTTERVTVAKGTEVNRLYYVENIVDDKDSRVVLYRNIIISGEVNTQVVGEYEVVYYVVDADGNKSNEAKLTIVVE